MASWSYSAIKLFDTCPRKYHAEKVEKLYPFQETEHTIYGKEVHKAAEEYIRDGKDLHPGYEKFRKALDVLARISGTKYCEYEMALNKDKLPVGFKDHQNVWVRGIVDLLIVDGDKAWVVDYKTGSAKYPDKRQLELMALMTFIHFPEVKRVKAALVFLVHDVVIKSEYLAEDAVELWQSWEEKSTLLDAAFQHDNWPPRPNGLCRRWCPVSHCEFSGD